MIAATPVDSIATFLENAGYRRLPSPLQIAGLKFNVTAAFVGSGFSTDLIIVADTIDDTGERTRINLEGIARALDTASSRRPLTAVLSGPRPNTSMLDAMSRVCRVLPIGSSDPANADAAMRNWLAALLPLHIPQPSESDSDPVSELRLLIDADDDFSNQLIDAAAEGATSVEAVLHDHIAEPFADLEDGEN